MIEVGDDSKAHGMVRVARAFPSFFDATSRGLELMQIWSGVDQGFDGRDESGFVMSGACLSRRLERVEL